jgi:DNA-binding NtrC family response regulator
MNIVEQLSVLHPGENIKTRHLSVSLGEGALVGKIFESFPLDRPLRDAVSEFESRYIEKVLSKTSGNKSLAARLLGLSRKVLWEKLKRNPHS